MNVNCNGPYCVRDYQIDDRKTWTIPTWSHPLGRVVTPLFTKIDGRATPIGTGFCVFSGGMFLTAGHVLDELYKNSLGSLNGEQFISIAGEERRIRSLLGRSPEARNVAAPMMALSVRNDVNSSPPTFIFGESRFATAIEPTDIGIFSVDGTFTNADAPWRWETLPMSPNLPRPGDTVYCIGHHNYANSEYIDYEDFGSPDGQNIVKSLGHDFRVSMGKVTDVYVEKYVTGYADGPCFRINCPIEHGQSGGPVINSSGYVCGINMCGTLDNDDNACLAATIAPGLGGLTTIPESMSQREGLPREVSLAALMKSGRIATDGGLGNIAIHKRQGEDTYLPLEAAILFSDRDGTDVPIEVREKCGDLTGFHLDFEDG